jgi:hypothetical protein
VQQQQPAGLQQQLPVLQLDLHRPAFFDRAEGPSNLSDDVLRSAEDLPASADLRYQQTQLLAWTFCVSTW